MARRHWDGFTAYSVVQDLDHLYTRGGAGALTNIEIIHDGGPTGQGSVRFGGQNTDQAYIYRVFTASSEIIFGAKLKMLDWNFDAADTLDEFLTFGSGGAGEFHVQLNNDYSLDIYAAGSRVYQSSVATDSVDGLTHYLFPGAEYKFELKFLIDASVGTVELRVDGVVWALLENIDTLFTNSTYNRCYIGVAASGDGGGIQFEIAEWYLFDTSGTYANDFLGEWEAQILRPTTDTAASDFTPLAAGNNEAEVDETGKHDQDASYNSSATNGHIDRFTTTDSIAGTSITKVIAANVIGIARHDGTASNMRTKVRHTASDQNGSTVAANAEDYRPFITTSDVNPSTSAQWTVAGIEAAEFGYEKMA
jgi:hypothetical protein